MDQMLVETEKLRAEEETMAELERIRAQAGNSLSPAGNWTVNVIANLIAFFGLLLALVLAAPQLTPLIANLATSEGLGSISALLTILAVGVVVVLAGGLIYLLVHRLLDWLLLSFARYRRHRRQRDERYYYEMDLRLDLPITPDMALELFAGTFADDVATSRSLMKDKGSARRLPRIEQLQHHGLERNSYRIGRTAADEALHKIYLSAVLRWPGRWLLKERLRALLAYEVLFHSPAAVQRYRLKDLRVVATTVDILDAERLGAIKALIIEHLVNPLISESRLKLDPDKDALMSLVTDQSSSARQIAESKKTRLARRRRTR
jgi:hypothetical protein